MNRMCQQVAVKEFLMEWGIDTTISNGGGLQSQQEASHVKDPNRREVYLLQRRSGKLGAGLGKTTG
jgi:2,4-dienoyl-CoA reductase (NADPH2)